MYQLHELTKISHLELEPATSAQLKFQIKKKRVKELIVGKILFSKKLNETQERFKKQNTLEKLVILSTVDHKKYRKETIKKYFQCSKHKVDQARKLKSLTNGLEKPTKVTITRSNLNIQKCENFSDFLFNKKLFQDHVYHTTNMKFDDGNCQKIAHSILVTEHSHTVSFRSSGYNLQF